jgi:hypothetical protein
MSGGGTTEQTLNMTQLNGNVTFDKDLKVTVQLPQVHRTPRARAASAARTSG